MSCFHLLSGYSITVIAGHKISATKSLHCRAIQFTHGFKELWGQDMWDQGCSLETHYFLSGAWIDQAFLIRFSLTNVKSVVWTHQTNPSKDIYDERITAWFEIQAQLLRGRECGAVFVRTYIVIIMGHSPDQHNINSFSIRIVNMFKTGRLVLWTNVMISWILAYGGVTIMWSDVPQITKFKPTILVLLDQEQDPNNSRINKEHVAQLLLLMEN
jgi:hypothetical protein